MFNCLDKFDKRMEFVACVASIIKRKNTNTALEKLFNPCELDNIIFSVLVHIMEKSLFEEDDCTIDELESFLSQLLKFYQKDFSKETLHELTRYIVKDILQNKNDNYTYHIMDYSKGAMQSQSVRLIADRINANNVAVYFLTTQGYNMLLRTKEVDDILGFQIEKVRLKMLVQSKNYSKAFEQTQHLILMLNEKFNEIRLFSRKLRIDVFTASGEECENIIKSIGDMISDEYHTLEDIQNYITLYRKNILEDDGTTETREYLFKISKNIDVIFQKQRTLLAECMKLRNIYSETIRLALITRSVHRFDLQDVIISQLERYDTSNIHNVDEICAKLLSPLMFPKLPSILDIGLFYAPQLQREDSNNDDTLPNEDYIYSDEVEKRINERNEAHVTVVGLLLQYAQTSKDSFLLSELWEYYLSHSNIVTLTKEKLIFLVFLQLYEQGTINIEAWQKDPHKSTDCQGEFDLSYALGKVFVNHPDMFGVHTIHICKGEGKVLLSWLDTSFDIPCEQRVEMDNLKFIKEMV